MATVKINNKTYTVPELNFQHSVIMEHIKLMPLSYPTLPHPSP